MSPSNWAARIFTPPERRSDSWRKRRPGLHFTEETLKLLEGYSFHGNVRQLQNIV